MPFITVDHFQGVSAADRRLLAERLAQVVMQTYGAPPTNVRVFLRAFDPADVHMPNGEHESALPMIRVESLGGRTLDQRRALVQGLATVAAEVLRVPVENVRTIVYELGPDELARGEKLVQDWQ
jgi:phenylpyruvate tautomerase PptA (4-oxalocrotonate tautomerase family)